MLPPVTANPDPRAGPADAADEPCTTQEAARLLGLAVRSVQAMVDRGELPAWKTPGGHRRIPRSALRRWLARHSVPPPGSPGLVPGSPDLQPGAVAAPPAAPGQEGGSAEAAHRVLLIEDSRHFQNLVSLLVRRHFPAAELHVADDGIAGLLLAGRLQPQVLLVDILLPGIDGATLVTGLRSHPGFAGSRLIVVTSLQGEELQPYAFALQGLPVIHKPRLALELPAQLQAALAATTPAPAWAGA